MMIVGAVLLLCCSALLLVARARMSRDRLVRARFARLAGFDDPDAARGGITRWFAGLGAFSVRRDGRAPRERIRHQRMLWTPVVPLLAVAIGVWGEQTTDQLVLLALLGALLGWMSPLWVWRLREARHRGAVEAQVPVMVHLLIMTFDAGLTVERSLASIRKDCRRLVPDIAQELDQLFVRLDHGDDLAVALQVLDEGTAVEAFSDLVAVLRQLVQQGGEAKRSLLALADLLEIRRRQQLQERVSKMAGKMTVIMVVFFFPALFILLTGPALIAVLGSLGEVS